MKSVIFAFSKQGCETALKIKNVFKDGLCDIYSMEKYCFGNIKPIKPPVSKFTKEFFESCDTLIYVGAVGIAVRAIAPYVKDKKTDPAVIALDEKGQFAISLLSGHIGGANELTAAIAKEINAVPVITTATDINDKFSVDTWATKNNMYISNMVFAKLVSAQILEKDVPLSSDFNIATSLPNGLKLSDSGELGISVSYLKRKPFDKTLLLVPRILTVGIGCRRGTPKADIENAVNTVLSQNNIDFNGIKKFASIDLKQDEAGLLEFCKDVNKEIEFFTSEQLNNLKGEFSHSDFVKSVTGVDSVCERAALLNAHKLIVRKTVVNSVTIAVAEEDFSLSF